MAKIIYFKSALDARDTTEINTEGITIRAALVRLGIANFPLCVTINGETPDDVDLNYKIKPDDLIEIRSLLEGGGNSETKSGIAVLVQIASIALSLYPPTAPFAAAILVGGQVISGIFSKWAMDLAGRTGQDEKNDADISSNSYSLTNASNEARILAPLPIPMGVHRFAPDIHTDAFVAYYGEQFQLGESTPTSGNFYPGQISTNGGADVNNNWATMPPSYIDLEPAIPNTFTFPIYELKIAPYHFALPQGPLSPSENTRIINQVRDYFFDNLSSSISWTLSGEFSPLVVYHSDPADPYFGRYNLWYFIARQADLSHRVLFQPPIVDYVNMIGAIFSGANQTIQDYITSWPITGTVSNKNAIRISTLGSQYYYPSTIATADNQANVRSKNAAMLLAINNGNYASNKTDSFLVPFFVRQQGVTNFIKEGTLYSTQIFSYGIGDLEINSRRIGATEVDTSSMSLAKYSEGSHGQFPFIPLWQVPSLNGGLENPPVPVFATFYNDVLSIESKRLQNNNAPNTIISTGDEGQYNFSYFEGKENQSAVSFSIVGYLYSSAGGGFSSNTTMIQLQYKWSNGLNWQDNISNQFNVINLTNNKAGKITVNYWFEMPWILGGMPKGVRMQVRVRKVTRDADDNENGKVCNLTLDNIRFIQTPGYSVSANLYRFNAPIIRDGLYMTALVTDSARTSKYSARVSAKCWVYNFDTETWVWQVNRNPAYWFLFFAYGGFLNSAAEGLLTYPYSPTWGWVNYPGHPDSTELIFGAGYNNDQIDLDRILEWALFCDEQELTIDMVFKDDVSVAETLDRIAGVGRASSTYYHGILSVIFEDPQAVPVTMFGMANIIAGSFSVDYSVGDQVGKVVGKYVDGETWDTREVEAAVPYTSADNLKIVEVNLEGIIDPDLAQRTVNLLAARQFFQRRTYSWQTDAEGYLAERGDLIYLSHDSTQYGHSGRIMAFVVDAGIVTRIKTAAILESSIGYVTVRGPDGTMFTYECSVDGSDLVFEEEYPIERAPFYISPEVDNADTDYLGSIPEDFIFIAGAKETPGKIVRIAEVRPDEQGIFQYTAVDEDPAMWAYEYDETIPSESFDDAEVALSVTNVRVEYPGEGLVKIFWENVNGEMVQIVNTTTNTPIESNGSFTFTGGVVTLELVKDQKYNLEIRPFAIGTPYKSVNYKVRVWPQ